MKIDFKQNKISFVMFLIGCALLLIASNTKYLYGNNREWYVNFLGTFTYKYDEFFTLIVVLTTISIYLFIYKNDEIIKGWVKLLLNKINFQKEKLMKVVSPRFKFLKRPKNNDNKNEIIPIEIKTNKTKSKLSTFILIYIVLVLFVSFLINDKFLFFIFLPFYFFVNFKPKSYKDVYIKTFLNPLYFVLLFAFFRSEPHYNIVQNISSNLVYYVISAILIYFTLRDKLKNKREFSFKHPLFWISSLYLIQAIFLAILKSRIDKLLIE